MDQYITNIALTGKKKSIVKMLNAVINNVGLEEAIVEVDGLETINRKLTDDDGDGVVIGIPDLLSAEYLKDEVLLQKKAEFEKDSEEGELYNVSAERAIEFVRVEDSGDEYIAKFSLYEYEEYCYADYADWSDIARLYGCQAFIDTSYYHNGRFSRFQQAVIHEPKGEEVKTTMLNSGETEEEYDRFFEQLVALCPERYLPKQKLCLKEKADRQEYKDLTEKHGIAIHHGLWTRFASWEGENSVETLRKVFEANVNEAVRGRENITQDEFATVLRLRAEKWQGVNDEFAECYSSLLAELPEVWEQETQKDLKDKADEQEYKDLTQKLGVTSYYGLWKRFASWEDENGVEVLREVIIANINDVVNDPLIIPQDEFAIALRLRAEKWKGLNDGFAKCYASLLAELPKIWEQDVQQDTFAEYEKKKDSKSSDEDDDEDLPF